VKQKNRIELDCIVWGLGILGPILLGNERGGEEERNDDEKGNDNKKYDMPSESGTAGIENLDNLCPCAV
jgi:hypothetical protein